MNTPKVLFFDIETSSMMSYHWGLREENISLNQIIEYSNIMCYAAKWGHNKKIFTDAIWDYDDYIPHSRDDYSVVYTLRELLDEADIVVAHNAPFDVKVFNTRCIYHGMKPVSPFVTVDTLAIARRKFRFASNRLDSLGDYLGVGRKVQTGGFDLWRNSMEGDEDAQELMVKYNKQDVQLLVDVYHKLRPYDDKTPALSNFYERMVCNACGSEHVRPNGTRTTLTRKYQRYVCTDCGHSMRGTKALPRDVDVKQSILRSC